MKSTVLIWKTVLVWLAFVASARAAGPQTSAHYIFSAEMLDGGGLRAASADYKNDSSFGAGGFGSSLDYRQRGGYAGQLNNAPVATNFTLTVISNTIIKVPISALLSAATDAEGDSISFVSIASASAQSGKAGRDGNWVLYAPAAGFTGADSVTWVMQDSEGDQSGGIILALVTAPSPTPDQPTLNLVAVTFDPASSAATLRFASLPGLSYTVQSADSLTPPVNWTTLGTATTTNGVFTLVDPTARNASQRFYRTLVQTQ